MSAVHSLAHTKKHEPEYDRLRRERSDEVTLAVCRMFGLLPTQILALGRKPTVVTARTFVAMLLRIDGYLMVEIAEVINRNHTTVCHLLNVTFNDCVSRPFNAKAWGLLLKELGHKKI